MERRLTGPELISVREISGDFPFGLRYGYEDAGFEASLGKRGILSPLWAVRKSTGQAVLISGHKRFSFALREKWAEVPVLFFEEDLSESDCFFLSLYSNWNQAFSDLDRMTALHKAVEVFQLEEKEICGEVLPALGLRAHSIVLKEYLTVGKLPQSIHELMQSQKIPFRGASSLAGFSEAEQSFLASEVLARIHVTSNQLMLLCEWLKDLKKIRRDTLEGCLVDPVLQEILVHPNLDPRARGEQWFERVRSLRNPRLSEEAKAFARFKARWEEVEGIGLERSQGSESGIVLRAQLKTRESIAHLVRLLETQRQSLETFL